jgi:hypothetical protein
MDIVLLRQRLTEMVRRHDSLRTYIDKNREGLEFGLIGRLAVMHLMVFETYDLTRYFVLGLCILVNWDIRLDALPKEWITNLFESFIHLLKNLAAHLHGNTT